jgi:hypothetical protein
MEVLKHPIRNMCDRPSRPARFAGGPSIPVGQSWIVLVLFVLAMGVAGAEGAPAPAPTRAEVPERQLKAVFLFHFTRFVEWPAGAFATPDAPFVIGVIGPDPFGNALEESIAGEFAQGRPIVVRRFRLPEDVRECQILFVNVAEPALARVLTLSAGRPILTVGETDSFAQRGGIVRFRTEQRKVRLRLNLDAAREAGLVISSKLARLAEEIYPPPATP